MNSRITGRTPLACSNPLISSDTESAAYFFLRNWLGNFAYRIPLGIGIFVFPAGLSLAIALFTVGGQALRAARITPARSLRYE
jgi:ABC-type antimicrobial peptide transport system permease subunit